MQKLGMDIEKISQDTIEDFIKFREERIIETKLYIMENSDYGNKIYNELKIKCENNEIYYDQMESMCFEKIPYAFLTYYPEKEKIYHFIKYPIVSLYNEGIRGLDISLIHELIHKIEWNIRLMCGLNLHDEKNTNKIVNEIRTQKLAIKITHKLHNAKVFIYDNPNDYKIEGESDYERMFPLVSDFFEEYESFFKECAINNAIDKLEEKFGESWHDFSSYINYIFDLMEQSFKLNKNPIKNFIDKNMIETSLNLIQSMKEYSNHKARIA